MVDLEWLRGAHDDLFDCYLWFERFGRGDTFYETLDQALARLTQFPEMGAVYSPPFRRIVLRNWHHGIFSRMREIESSFMQFSTFDKIRTEFTRD